MNREINCCIAFFFFYIIQWFFPWSSHTSLNLQMRLSIKWGGAQLIPTAFTLSLLFMASRHCWKLSPDGAFSPSTQLKQIQDGILMFSSSSNSTQAWNCQFRCYIKRQCITKTVEVRIGKCSLLFLGKQPLKYFQFRIKTFHQPYKE